MSVIETIATLRYRKFQSEPWARPYEVRMHPLIYQKLVEETSNNQFAVSTNVDGPRLFGMKVVQDADRSVEDIEIVSSCGANKASSG